jgi:hypothetical protein
MSASTHHHEHTLVAERHPAYVTPRGDRRERPVPCAECGDRTLAIRGLCPRHQDSEVVAPPTSDAGDVPPSRPERDVTGTTEEKSPRAAATAEGMT